MFNHPCLPRPLDAPGQRHDRCCHVVWVQGEHDMATADRLQRELEVAIAFDDADIAVDLSGVAFMDASTIGALAAAQAGVKAPWTLQLRDPSPCAARVIALCSD